jgi:predicted dehydrogenase/GNAT superfamily N-acetyltransferase
MTLRVAVVGALGRGRSFVRTLNTLGEEVVGVCDLDPDATSELGKELGAGAFTDAADMVVKTRPDAVVVATPMHVHVEPVVAALEAGAHVLCEVPAAVDEAGCRAIAKAATASGRRFVLSENYNFDREVASVTRLVRDGRFGETYYAEGAYLHDIRWLIPQTPWRRHWQTGIAGNTYITHSLGPVVRWFGGRRVESVCCTTAGQASRFVDEAGKAYAGDTPVTLCRFEGGATATIRLDLVSPRPGAGKRYELQGTRGCFESADLAGGRGRIWLEDLSDRPKWLDLETLIGSQPTDFLPDSWREHGKLAAEFDHGGGDYFVVRDFLAACRDEPNDAVGLDEAMNLTLAGLASQQSASEGGSWVPVRTTDELLATKSGGSLHMLWPADRPVPPPTLPAGYTLRPFHDGDTDGYLSVMNTSGLGKDWTAQRVGQVRDASLPDGLLVITHDPSGEIVAVGQAQHRPMRDLHPAGGEVGWIAASPTHAGKRLGQAITLAAAGRLQRAGYRRIYLMTDDHRLPAIVTYLRVGFEPMRTDATSDRWDTVLAKLA